MVKFSNIVLFLCGLAFVNKPINIKDKSGKIVKRIWKTGDHVDSVQYFDTNGYIVKAIGISDIDTAKFNFKRFVEDLHMDDEGMHECRKGVVLVGVLVSKKHGILRICFFDGQKSICDKIENRITHLAEWNRYFKIEYEAAYVDLVVPISTF